jgi:A/G-specific adenine glycosylase
MDYGTHLKQNVGNASKASASYSKQSKFEGSRRQVRGSILRLLAKDGMTLHSLKKLLADERLESVLEDLVKEGFIVYKGSMYELAA